MAESATQRLGYLDWLRGLACFGMFEVHCYDAWLGGPARQSAFFGWSQFSGTIPAPLFVFLSGVSSALVAGQMRRKGAPAKQIGARMIRRGTEVFALGLLFRAQEFIFGRPAAPWTDFFRVDVLNLIGLSIVFMGILCWVVGERVAGALAAAGIALGIAMLTPPLWTTWCLRWLPWYLESYINGVHIYGSPQPWLFPIFPWAAFAFAGLAAGLFLFNGWPMGRPGRALVLLAAGGVGIFLLSLLLDARGPRLYAVYDYWHTSPNFFLGRVGAVLVIMLAGYAWCRWGLGAMGFSPLRQLGKTSLLVYWVHMEFVYGRFSIFEKQSQGILMATVGLFEITAAMLLLSIARTRSKGRGKEILAWFRRLRSGQVDGSPRAAAEG
ncbi:MAG: heparan-alpha-glucosaminide N-acetyltransferase domain-containing protein [Candidatus Acidiferrales bacterium]|jgi:uncharacterized membrane protein